eukprot:Rmarinus@m.15134
MGAVFSKGVTRGANGEVLECLFCDIVSGKEAQRGGTRVAHSTDDCVVFPTIKPQGRYHMLAVPREHIDNTDALRTTHEAVLLSLKEEGSECLRRVVEKNGDQFDPNLVSFSFHAPPFNSIEHIHLHVIYGPLRTWWSDIIHTPAPWKPWCSKYEDVLEGLKHRSM